MKKYKNSLSNEKVIGIAGAGMIALSIIATIFSSTVNQLFVNDFLDVIYYTRYALLLVGGFLIGWFIAYKRQDGSRLMTAMIYSLMAIPLFFAIDPLRLPFNSIGYPWGKLLFQGMPLAVLLIAAILAFALRHGGAKIALVIIFVISQLEAILTITSAPSESGLLSMQTIVGALLLPIITAVVAYCILTNVASRFSRLFYACLVGVINLAFTSVFWEFRTDPNVDATNLFSAITNILMVIICASLIVSLRFVANDGEGRIRSARRQPQRSRR